MFRLSRLALVLAFVALRPALAADVYIDPVEDYANCRVWLLCNAQASGTVCLTGSDNAIIRAGDEYTWSAWADESPANGNWTIKIYDKAPGSGYSATDRTLINSTDMDVDNMKFSWNGLSGDIHAVLANTLTGGVTLRIKGCRLTVEP